MLGSYQMPDNIKLKSKSKILEYLRGGTIKYLDVHIEHLHIHGHIIGQIEVMF